MNASSACTHLLKMSPRSRRCETLPRDTGSRFESTLRFPSLRKPYSRDLVLNPGNRSKQHLCFLTL